MSHGGRIDVASGLVSADRFCSRQGMGLKPKCAGSRKRVYSRLSPPQSFIAAAMDLAVVRATQRHRELVADLAAKGWRLCKLQVVSVSGNPTADQARELGNRLHMLPVANPPRHRQRHDGFVDSRWSIWLSAAPS